MASAGPSTGKGGRRKSLDAELNLVPFIDLLSMCICFLLMTAVWMEVGAVQVKQLVGTEGPATTANSYEMDLKYLNREKVEVNLSHGGKKAQKFVVQGATREALAGNFEVTFRQLASILKLNQNTDLKSQMGKAISVARVTPKTDVPYGDLVALMDQLRDHGIVNLGVIPSRE